MFILFFLPFLAATLAYSLRDSLILTTKNYGELINPPQSIQDFSLLTMQGNGVSKEALLGKWSLVLIAPKNCTDCTHQVEKITSVFYALNRDSTRVRRLVLNAQPDDVFIPSDSEIMTYVISADNNNPFVKELTQNTASKILLVDPLGNIVMRYPADAQGNGILRDMLQLLKVSRIG